MSLNDAIDQYCERLGPEFWAEPLNAWTNLGFVLVGLWLWLKSKDDAELRIFAVLVATIGIGSGLFHTYATRWAMAADVIPIGVALVYALWAYQRRVFGFSARQASFGLAAFSAVTGVFAVAVPRERFNGSHTYFPCLLLLLLLAHRASAGVRRRVLVAASLTFAISLTCRTIDMSLCEIMPLGTHFLWHLLNAVTLLLVGIALMRRDE